MLKHHRCMMWGRRLPYSQWRQILSQAKNSKTKNHPKMLKHSTEQEYKVGSSICYTIQILLMILKAVSLVVPLYFFFLRAFSYINRKDLMNNLKPSRGQRRQILKAGVDVANRLRMLESQMIRHAKTRKIDIDWD